MHLVEAAGRRILLDCGLVHGKKDEARKRNAVFPFAPASIDAVVLSHAHIDHCGNLPNLVRQGFDGPIYCTPATRDLLGRHACRLRPHPGTRGRSGRRRCWLRRQRDAQAVHALGRGSSRIALHRRALRDAARDRRRRTAAFLDAGHILGSAMAELTVAQSGKDHRILFTGDLGRCGLPFLRRAVGRAVGRPAHLRKHLRRPLP